MLHGCIPVVIQDNVDPVFATLLDWPSFSLRVAEASPCLCVPLLPLCVSALVVLCSPAGV